MKLLKPLLLAILFCTWQLSDACTAVYVGRQCSTNGTVIIARCCDFHPTTLMPYLRINEAVKGQTGRYVTGVNGFLWELPADTYRYVSLPFPEVIDYGEFESFALNENGVALTATITGYICKEASQADPNVPDGIAEETITSVIGPCIKTAREGVELLARIIDEKGNAERNIVMIADSKEAWYMEMYTGHQYCAIRMPEDMVAAFGNEFMLDTVDPKSDGVICSKDLFKLPQKHGFAVMDDNGLMNLRRTYQGDGRIYDFSHLRTWGGHRILSPSTSEDYNHSTYYPLFFRPDSKIDVATVKKVFRDRYDGTRYNPEESGCNMYRTIADEAQEEIHIIEVYDNLPAPMSCVAWLCLSEAAHAPFVPVSSNITSCSKYYGYESQAWGLDEEAAQHIYKKVNSFCNTRRTIYSQGVKDYWAMIESRIMEDFPEVLAGAAKQYQTDPSAAAHLLTTYETGLQNDCINDAQRIFDDLVWHMMVHTETNPFSSDFTNLGVRPRPMPVFDARYYVEPAALRKGWTVRKDQDNGTMELERNDVRIKLVVEGAHRNQVGSISITYADGTSAVKPAWVSWHKGCICLPMSTIKMFD